MDDFRSLFTSQFARDTLLSQIKDFYIEIKQDKIQLLQEHFGQIYFTYKIWPTRPKLNYLTKYPFIRSHPFYSRSTLRPPNWPRKSSIKMQSVGNYFPLLYRFKECQTLVWLISISVYTKSNFGQKFHLCV